MVAAVVKVQYTQYYMPILKVGCDLIIFGPYIQVEGTVIKLSVILADKLDTIGIFGRNPNPYCKICLFDSDTNTVLYSVTTSTQFVSSFTFHHVIVLQ
jgi:hypothetical protein